MQQSKIREIIFLVEDTGTAQALGSQQSIFTQGDSLEELKEMKRLL